MTAIYSTPEFKKKFEQALSHKWKGEWDQYDTLMNEMLEMMGVKQ